MRPCVSKFHISARGSHGRAIGGVRRLKNHKDGNRIDGVLESSAQKSRTVRGREHPAVASARSPYAGVLRDAFHAVASRRPELQFVPAFVPGPACARTDGSARNQEQSGSSRRQMRTRFIEKLLLEPKRRRHNLQSGKTIQEKPHDMTSVRNGGLISLKRNLVARRSGGEITSAGMPEASRRFPRNRVFAPHVAKANRPPSNGEMRRAGDIANFLGAAFPEANSFVPGAGGQRQEIAAW